MMPEQSSSSFLSWWPVTVGFLSAGFWSAKKVVSYGQRLAVLERAIDDDRTVRSEFMEQYREDRERYNEDRQKVAAMDERTMLILEELRRR